MGQDNVTAIEKLAELLKQGIIDQATFETAISGILNKSITVGDEGVLVEGDVEGSIITGDNNIIHMAPQPSQIPPSLAPLRDKISRYFNKSELNGLCFTLGIKTDELHGETLSEVAQSLVAFCYKRDRLDELKALCREERPNAEWN